jgi:hypothetical protein
MDKDNSKSTERRMMSSSWLLHDTVSGCNDDQQTRDRLLPRCQRLSPATLETSASHTAADCTSWPAARGHSHSAHTITTQTSVARLWSDRARPWVGLWSLEKTLEIGERRSRCSIRPPHARSFRPEGEVGHRPHPPLSVCHSWGTAVTQQPPHNHTMSGSLKPTLH